jgi:hypothetical protein
MSNPVISTMPLAVYLTEAGITLLHQIGPYLLAALGGLWGVYSNIAHKSTDVKIGELEVRVNTKFDALNIKMDALETKMDAKIGALETKMDAKIGALENKMETLEIRMTSKISTLETKIDAIGPKIDGFMQSIDMRARCVEYIVGMRNGYMSPEVSLASKSGPSAQEEKQISDK